MHMRNIEKIVLVTTIVLIAILIGYWLGTKNVEAEFVVHVAKPSIASDLMRGNDEEGAETSGTDSDSDLILPTESVIILDEHKVININTADFDMLVQLPGIGDSLATRIIEYREVYGNFKDIYELMNVSGIGEKKFDALIEMITVN